MKNLSSTHSLALFRRNGSWVAKSLSNNQAFHRNAWCYKVGKTFGFLLLLLFFKTNVASAQNSQPFWNEIQEFKKEDSLTPPPKNAIVFAGSSSFRLWKNVQEYFPKLTIINRGFGGSSLPDVIRYQQETILKYKPKQIVIYCGENDLASSDTVTAVMVLQRFKKLFDNIRTRQPNVPIVFVSIKPSPSRWQLKDKMVEANRLIEKFLATKKKTAFADVWPLMLNGDGKPNEALFVEDKLHMNAEGYAIWAKVLDKYLK